MNKTQLVKQVAGTIGVTEKSVQVTLDTLMAVITEAVANGDKVTLVGFGTFEPRERQEREGRNPKTGEAMIISATTYPAFSAGKYFKDAVADGREMKETA